VLGGRAWLDLVYVIWLDEERARAQLEAARDVHDITAVAAGVKRHQLPDWEDPADQLAPPGPDGAGSRAPDPAERATQIRSFIAAAGGEAG
jgi:hypothetical protein